MKALNDVTLLSLAGYEAGVVPTVKALKYSMRGIRFGRVVLFAAFNPEPACLDFEFVQIPCFKSVEDWGKWVVYELHKHVTTQHIMLIHSDGFIVNPESWDDEFLEYDYIGAPWPLPKDEFSYRDARGNIVRVGNSVSLRSRKLLQLPFQLGLPWEADHGFFHEDGFLCVKNRHILQEHGIKFAPLSLACRFAHERPIPENRGIKPFAFHKWMGPNRQYPRFTKESSAARRAWNGLKARFGPA